MQQNGNHVIPDRVRAEHRVLQPENTPEDRGKVIIEHAQAAEAGAVGGTGQEDEIILGEIEGKGWQKDDDRGQKRRCFRSGQSIFPLRRGACRLCSRRGAFKATPVQQEPLTSQAAKTERAGKDRPALA